MVESLVHKKSNCRNCYKCIRNCPVKSIRFSGNQAQIVSSECILCGQCYVICPQNAKQVTDETEKARVLIQSGAPVIASIAPSFVANYNKSGIDSIRKALVKLGFSDAEETAIGATIVKNEYERILRDENKSMLISSCCHSINLLIQKYFPSTLSCLADVMSPMQAHCMDIKRRNPEAKTVFIGPCVAKKDEADHYGEIVDAVLTFEELSAWLKAEGVEIEKSSDSIKESKARFFPITGGILKTMNHDIPNMTYVAIDGVENCMEALRDIEAGTLKNCFIEMSACAGSCIGGPVMEKHPRSPVSDYVSVSAYAGESDFQVDMPDSHQLKKRLEYIEREAKMPSESDVNSIIRRMGKFKPSQELNCGTCGYNTCRDKAVAVFQGKADMSMCLPFLKDRAESFSDTIIDNTPNGILVLNDKLEVQQINRAALRMMNIPQASVVLGEPVVRILEPAVFIEVQQLGRSLHAQKIYLAEYKRYVEQTILYDGNFQIQIVLMRDITDEEDRKKKKDSISYQTVEIADKVVDKQLRIVQEIASLLGETAAETKIALAKLKELISDE